MKKLFIIMALIAGCGASQDSSPHDGENPRIPIPQYRKPLPTVPPVETSTPDPNPTPTPDVSPTFTPVPDPTPTPAPACPDGKKWLCHHPQGDDSEPFSCIWMCKKPCTIEYH